jgi:ribosomal protein L11 methyltransferase
METFVQIHFSNLQPEQKDILIARLADAGFEGFEETDDTLDAFIKSESYDQSLLSEIAYKYQLPFTEKILPSQNWNALWESNFSPVLINDFVGIRAEFHQPVCNVMHELIITPKMSFGTGHHATTAMMIKQMQGIDFSGKTVFDYGTGTGVLAILAEKLGAAHVLAIDIDSLSIENAFENIKRNSCRHITVQQNDTARVNKTFDIILANINKNVILENLAALYQQLNKNGILLISGVLMDDKEQILEAISPFTPKLKSELSENNWLCLKFEC